MRAAIGFDRSYTDTQMGTAMLNISLTPAQRDNDESAPWITPAAKVASGAEWLEFGCAYYWNCGSKSSDFVVLDSYDNASEMHLCKHCHEYDVTNYSDRVTTVRSRIRVKPVEEDAGFTETDEIVESEDMYEGMRNRLKNKACGYRPFLKVVSDTRNNVGRRCSYTRNGENLGRVWELLTPMRDQEFVSYYLIRNVESGEQCIVWDRLLHNLY